MDQRRVKLQPIVVDILIAVGVFTLGLLSRDAVGGSELRDLFSREPDLWNTVLIGVQTLPLALRRRYPATVLLVIIGGFVLDRMFDYPASFATTAGMVVAFHALGSEWDPKRSMRLGWGLIVALIGFTFLGVVTVQSIGYENVLGTLVAVAVPFHIGREVHQRRRRIEALEERAETAEREREEEARVAVAEERARIARELHDVVAHQMTVMTVQAEGARRVAKDGDERVVAALDTIRQSGHEALQEMRRMVGLLRAEPDGVPLDPQPGVDRLDDLVDQMSDAGLAVELRRDGQPRPLAPGVDVNVYRIVQESLTNALKHGGPGVTASVALNYAPDGLEIAVVDDGRGGASSLADKQAGHGLVGMRERVALLDGEFAAGPAPGGGFEVRASIPVPA